MRLALLCDEAAGAHTLQVLLATAHPPALLLASPGGAAWTLGQRAGVTAIAARRVNEPGFEAELERCGVELLLSVHSPQILPAALLAVPRYGAYNLHPGPLPDYAGMNAPSWAIYNDEAMHGVTLHRIEPGSDSGPVVLQERFPVHPEDTGLTLSLRCIERGLALVDRLLVDPLAATQVSPQRGTRRYFGRGVPQDGRLEWSAPARRIHALVRACDYHPFASPWGAPRASVGGFEADVFKTALTGERCHAPPGTLREEDGRLRVATGDEWLLLRRHSGLARPGTDHRFARAGFGLRALAR